MTQPLIIINGKQPVEVWDYNHSSQYSQLWMDFDAQADAILNLLHTSVASGTGKAVAEKLGLTHEAYKERIQKALYKEQENG